MNKKNDNKLVKEKIFKVAVKLFAKKGYSAVGVREIAREADVNIAMISYYFGGKAGIMKAVINEFFDNYHVPTVKKVIEEGGTVEEILSRLVRGIVGIMKKDPNLCKVAVYDMPYDMSEVNELRAEKIGVLKGIVSTVLFSKFQVNVDDHSKLLLILGPAFLSLLFSHFLLGDVAGRVMNIEFDDEFFERYTETITILLLKGISGFAESFAEGGKDE